MRAGWDAVAAALLLAACGGDGSSAAPANTTAAPRATTTTTVPDGQWRPVEPEDAGFDARALEAIAAEADQARSTCLLVTRDGRLAGEWHFDSVDPDAAQEVYSVTKSVTSVLVGIAADDGDLELDDPASTWIEQWRGTPAEGVTVRDLLTNASGRHWDLASDYLGLLTASDRTAYGIGLAQDAPPGEVWAYNNAAIQTLEAVLEEATGEPVADFAEERLFGPLGMDATRMTTDPAGNALTFMGVQSTCRDLARFGQLVLQEGEWDGEQLVAADYLEEATGRPSTELNAAYGYLWWLNHEGRVADAGRAARLDPADDGAEQGRYVDGAPASMFWAVGLGNQIVQVDPGSDTVVVRLGPPELRATHPTFGARAASRVVTEALVDR